MADKRYLTQTGTITELLDAQTQLTQAEVDISQALLEYQSSRAKFFFYIGIENLSLQ
jgi:outer membrane protein TolC